MSKCFNCGVEFTLKEEDIRCDSCGTKVNFPCHNCKQWFSIEGTKLCKTCGFYICPNCNICGDDCQKYEWSNILKEIIPTITEEQLKKVLEMIEEIKIGKDRRICPRGVSISYAKSRIKSCIVRLLGYRIKNQKDLERFKERVEEVTNKNPEETLTIKESREAGSYGQEYRDVFNYLVCEGKLERLNIEKIIDGTKVKLEVYKRCEKGTCPQLDLKNLIKKKCPNKKCNISVYPIQEQYCIRPECYYKSKNKKGQPRELKVKISNKDICKLPRGEFKKEEENGGNKS